MTLQINEFIPSYLPKGITTRTMARVSAILHVDVNNPLDLARISRTGIAPSAVDLLTEQGFHKRDLEWIVPARTLSHRRQQGQTLTVDETGRWFRAAKIAALAQEVLGSAKAVDWLHKPRKMFDDLSAVELIKTEAGAQLVEETLMQLDEGYFA
jgi:putative toxin-antitoxin system antitoxin component (TIGR02293 family)